MKTENHYEGFNKNELKSNIYTELNDALIDNVNYVECQKKNAEMCSQIKKTLDENVNIMREKQKILNVSKDKRNKSNLEYADCDRRIKNCDINYKEIMEKTKELEEINKEIERIENEEKELDNNVSMLNNDMAMIENKKSEWENRWKNLSFWEKMRLRQKRKEDERRYSKHNKKKIAELKKQRENNKQEIEKLKIMKVDNKRLQNNKNATITSLQSLYNQNNCKTTPNCFREQDNIKAAEQDFMSAESNYNTAKSNVNKINTEYEICNDPLRNLCKDKIKEFEMDHERINKNIKKLNKEGYANLEENIELNNQLREMQNNNVSKRIQEKKKLYTEPHIKTLKEKDPNSLLENEICKNVVLTTISSVLLYYFFFEI